MNKEFYPSYKQRVGGSTPSTPTRALQKCKAFLRVLDKHLTNNNLTDFQFIMSLMLQ